MKKFAIFDLDGTLVDSMGYWKNLSVEYLTLMGVKEIPADILERIKPMTVKESAALFVSEFSLDATPEQVAADIAGIMSRHYIEDIPIKPGVAAYLEKLAAKGVRMCVASATVEPLIDACLERLGIRQFFEFTLSCDTVGAGKKSPLVYQRAAEMLGTGAGDCAVYEDAVFAAQTAKKAGFFVYAVCDQVSRAGWEQLCGICDDKIEDWAAAASAL